MALSWFFSGSIVPPPWASSGKTLASCVPLLQSLGNLMPVEEHPTSFLALLVEVLQGLFPSVGGALQALTHTAPRHLQEILFGGRFLQNAASSNFSGVVGSRGALVLDQLSSQSTSLLKNQLLVRSISRALEEPAFLFALQTVLRGYSHSQSLKQVNRKCYSKLSAVVSVDEPAWFHNNSSCFSQQMINQ